MDAIPCNSTRNAGRARRSGMPCNQRWPLLVVGHSSVAVCVASQHCSPSACEKEGKTRPFEMRAQRSASSLVVLLPLICAQVNREIDDYEDLLAVESSRNEVENVIAIEPAPADFGGERFTAPKRDQSQGSYSFGWETCWFIWFSLKNCASRERSSPSKCGLWKLSIGSYSKVLR